MKKIILMVCVLCLVHLRIQAQGKEQLQVLKKAKIGYEYVFGTWTAENEGETHLTYLGKFHASNGKTYQVMTSKWLWGLSKRATNRILIFDGQNRYLGNYMVSVADDLPYKMEKGKMWFKNTEECPNRSLFSVDLRQGVPEKIFIECSKGAGDEYVFEKG
ncbi:hypothetical protein [Pedobacter nutrimenti]|nr:hypothetical protein [Pedobacter nutrimenti]